MARQQADRVGVRRDDVVGAHVHGVHDAQRLSVAVQYSAAQEVAEALGLSVARPTHERRPRGAARGMALWGSARRG